MKEAQACSPSSGALRFGDSPSSHMLFTLPPELQNPRYDHVFLSLARPQTYPVISSEQDMLLVSSYRQLSCLCEKRYRPAQSGGTSTSPSIFLPKAAKTVSLAPAEKWTEF